MRTSLAVSLITTALVSLVACADDPPAKDPSTASADANAKSPPPAASDANAKSSSGGGDSAKPADTKSTSAGTTPGKTEISCKGKPDIGKNASAFSMSTVNGGNKLSVDKGKVTIVDFWATWCEPCKKSFPKYQELYVKYKASGLEIVAVSVDDEKKDIPDFIKSYGAKFPVGWDEGHKIAECYHPPNMPSAYVIDKTGVIKFVHNGYHDGEEKELEKEIKSLL